MLPVVLVLLNLPNDGFSARFRDQAVRDLHLEEIRTTTIASLLSTPASPTPLLAASLLAPPDVVLRDLSFKALETAAFTSEGRSFYSGKVVTVVGMFVSSNDSSSFSLIRYKMSCC